MPHRRNLTLERRALWSCAAVLVGLSAGIVTLLPAADERAEPPRVLVLFDGRVVTGNITEQNGGYFVLQANGGQVFMPFDVIRLAATSLAEAYEKQRDTLKRPTAGDHLTLAQWCFDNKLHDEAKEQLAAALRLEPQRSDARSLLKQVAAAQENAAAGAPRDGQADATAAASSSRAMSGLQPATSGDFTRRIQPVLVNKCGNATCHGSASNNSFHLLNPGLARRQRRLETEQNLTATLGQIDRERPDLSPLLRKPQDRESLVHRGVFIGPLGDGQIKMLQEWVRQAAGEMDEPVVVASAEEPPEIQQASGVAAPGEGAVSQAGAVSPLVIEIPRTPKPRERAEPPVRRSAPALDDAAFLKSILDEERPDPFDPDEFNRQVHGRAGGK